MCGASLRVGLVRPADQAPRIFPRLDAARFEVSDEIRVQGWYDPIMVGSAATVADHNVPGAHSAALIHMRTKLKLPLAKKARNHMPVLRHGSPVAPLIPPKLRKVNQQRINGALPSGI